MTSFHALTGVLSTASSSNSSSLSSQRSYDVFLSFRGKDTRYGFTNHLYNALHQKGFNTYIDDKLRRGEEISTLFNTIEESKISIVVFSENYASSTWCLDELMKILECKESKQQKVLPIFYKVEPATIRHQMNSFKDALSKHETRFKDDAKVQKWKIALKQVADISGFPLKTEENESKFIEEIVREVSKIVLNRTYLHVAEYPVGINSRVEEINMRLCIKENDKRMIGIFGVGGIGKTTIAKEMYNRIYDQFEGSCFLANVRESSKQDQGGLVKLQQTILSDILKDSSLEVSNVDRGINLLKERLCRRRILLVLDDVDCLDQLEKLCRRCDWFGSGSRIIITTRDESLLTKHHVYLKYRMKEMDHPEALQLFSQHAFKSDKPDDAFADVIKLALKCADGLPLALQVIGSNLYGEDIHFWKSELEKYKRIPEENIYKKLKISFDGLDYHTKKIFLDIACFFKGDDREYVTKILDGCGFFADAGIKKLKDKCLITIDEYDQLMMHDLLEDMGKEIVRQESPEEPGKRSRLYFLEDVREVLEKNKGTEQIEGILINPPWEDNWMIRLDSEVFAKMEKLRILKVRSYDDDSFCSGLNYLSNELRVIDWLGCPLEFLPSNFHGEKLIDLALFGSMISDLGTGLLSKNLISIDLSYCKYLTKISDLSSCLNLEVLLLQGCGSLVKVHDSVGFLDKLVELNFRNCSSLKKLPRSLKLISLKVLELEGCTSLEYFPEIECEMEYLKSVKLERCEQLVGLPSSITYLTGLEMLYINECDSLVHFPVNIFQLEHLQDVSIIRCPNFVNFGKEVGHNGQFVSCILSRTYNFSSTLKTLILRGSGIVSLSPCIEGFVGLSKLDLRDCKQLEEILHLPPNIKDVDVRGCSSLKNFFPESNNLSRTYNFSSSWRTLNLSFSGIVSLSPCIEGFVGLSKLDLRDCKQLEEILYLPPNIEEVNAEGCSSLKNFFPESNNLSRTYNFSSSLRTLNLCDSGIVSLSPCIEGFVGLSKLDLKFCSQLEEILYLPPNIEEVNAVGCMLLERFPHVSTESSFGTPDLKRLTWINLARCNKVEVDVGNHAPDPLLVQERFREKDSSTIIYSGSRIPEWFKYCKETTSFSNSIEVEIDHNASMCFGHQIVALVLCFVVGPAWTLNGFSISINGQQIGNYDTRFGSFWPMYPQDVVSLKYIAGNPIDDMLPRSYRKGNNNMTFTFESDSKEAIFKSVGVHLIHRNDNFIDPIQLSKRYRDDGEHDLEPDWNPQQKRQSSTTRIMEFKDVNDDLIIEDLDLELRLGNPQQKRQSSTTRIMEFKDANDDLIIEDLDLELRLGN